MEPLPHPSFVDFQRAITPSRLREMQLVYLALALGVLLFALVVVGLAFTTDPPPGPPPDDTLIGLLSFIHLVLAASVYTLLPFLYRRLLHHGYGTGVEGAQMMLARLRTADLVRLALLEGVALFGLVIGLIAALEGVLATHPLYAANGFSAVVMLGFVALSVPTRERLEQTFRQHIA